MTDRVTIGRVIKAHGIRGEVVVDPLTDLPDRFDVGVELVVADDPTRVRTSRPHQGRLLIAFEGITDRSAAERLRGAAIEADPVDVAEHEHYFVHELIDRPVVDEDDRALGRVVALVELPTAAGYDLLEVVADDGRVWLLPAVDDYVEVEEDDQGLRLRVVDPPEGLISGDADVAPSQPDEDGTSEDGTSDDGTSDDGTSDDGTSA